MWHRGNQAQFDTWESTYSAIKGLPIGGTTSMSESIPHPENVDDFIWAYDDSKDPALPDLSDADVRTNGWFPEVY